ncbi:hypothetical protein DQ04_01231090 [Trypanosoma grayi]|uniref:hypothetical protein n=1 Tax=Trypanosoma grayi TaxID=71804 RepID=UPI0004F40102|nr:hypothetical protein DQ04_01231090 [Trypanosoma grayi]KEG13074.1 hypothetical protein DQ04_01231090 [Trypanosoma grayi]
MMSGDPSVGKSRWSQGEDGEEALEIRIPITLPQSVRPKDLTVEVKDLAVLCVRHRDTGILQWRLFDSVAAEVEWRVEDEGMLLVVELIKKSPSVWPCLLDLPMRLDNELFVTDDMLDALFREQHPSLPATDADAPKESGDEEDLEKLLEEAAEEVVGAASRNNDKEFIQAELENYKTEEEEIRKKLLEVTNELEASTSDEARKQAQNQKAILDEMLRLHNVLLEKRRAPTTLALFLEIEQLDIRKARVNVGELSEEEAEAYATEEERAMTAHELMTTGLKHLGEQEVQPALHFLRLAAIHHNHEQSVLVLYSIYAQLGSPRGPYLLLKRALNDDDFSASANLKVGELFDAGARHFLPMFPAALYFYQRAARAGSVHAMLAIAQMYLRGCTTSTMLSSEQMEGLKSIGKYHAWIQQAVDRGCGSAYFVKGCMYLKGEHGCGKSYKMAKELLDMASSSQPDVARRAPQVYIMLEKLRQEEEGGLEPKVIASPLTLAKTKGSNTYDKANTGNEDEITGDNNGDDNVQSSASMVRLNNMSSKGAGLGSTVARPKKMMGRSSNTRAFWEKAVTSGLTVYSLYTILFPLRVLILPHIYTLLGGVVERIPWLSAGPPPMQF